MADDGQEPHFETEAARAASTPNIVRWILLVSLFAAIALLSIIWITGAATQSDAEDEVSVTARAADPVADDAESVDSIVGENADELDAAEPGSDTSGRTIENESATTLIAPVETGAN